MCLSHKSGNRAARKRRMISVTLSRFAGGIAAGLLMLRAAPGAGWGQQSKPGRHGISEPKSDAGFLLMAAKRGFAEREGLKLEILDVKDDQIGLKALLAGELD